MKSYDEPLFVLKYQKRKVIPMVVLWLLFVGLVVLICLVAHPRSTLELILLRFAGLLCLLIGGAFVTEMVLFKEIRLYRHRIVKAWKLIGTKELELAKVGLACEVNMLAGTGGKCFFEQTMSPYWRTLFPFLLPFFRSIGITYHEYFADQKNVKQLNALLAELTGRRVEEFDRMGIMERLFKREEA